MRLMLGLLLLFSFQSLFAEKYALVIGNEDYQGENSLPHSHNDAKVVAKLLSKANFKVTI